MLQLSYRENEFNLSLLHKLKMSQFHKLRDLKKLMQVFTWTMGN